MFIMHIGSGLAAPAKPGIAEFAAYADVYNKHYDEQSFWSHYTTYCDNVEYIDAVNGAGNTTYKLGINQFTDIPRSDFAKTHLSNRYNPHSKLSTMSHLNKSWTPEGVPYSIDWRANGWVTDVKDQGDCGSCWAFSAVGSIEGQHANATGQLVSFSEQNLVDCSYGYGCDGCGGGWPEAAMRYVDGNKGLDTEVSYPYTGTDGSCAYNKSVSGGTVKGTNNITSGSMRDLYSAIAHVGPISVAIDAESDFQFYSSGVFSSTDCSSEELDHAVLAVGYGVSPRNQKYIIVKNSWSADWGMDGYIYMSAEIPNMCGIASCASFPSIPSHAKHTRA
jgi:cathepsin L